MNSLCSTVHSSNGYSAAALKQHFWPKDLMTQNIATLFVSGFSHQVCSVRKNAVMVRGGVHFCSGALGSG